MEAFPLRDHRHQGFVSTHWTAIRTCAGNDDAAHAAREKLCRDYWYPLYAYIKRQGNDTHHAEDLTQDFLAYILRRPWFVRADQTKGKFRSFLLVSLDNFLRDRFDRRNARKRGGSYQHIPYDLGGTRARHEESPAGHVGPAQIYEVEWASAIVVATLKQLEDEFAAAGRQPVYDHLKTFLTTPGDAVLYQGSAAELNISAANVKVGVHRLRQRYGEILKERVALTVARPEDVEEELHYLRAVLTAS